MSEDKIVKKIHNDLIVKSIERETNYAIKCDYDTVMLYVDDIKELLSLYYQEQKKNDDYKMQDKEYQKLKEIVSSNQQLYSAFSFGRKYEKEMCKDKIKAKIEEYDDKGMTVNLANRSAGKTFQQAVHYEVKKVLQSLLEKE